MKRFYVMIIGILILVSLMIVQSVRAAAKDPAQSGKENQSVLISIERDNYLPQVSISTPSYPIGMSSGETKLIPYRFKEDNNGSGEIVSQTLQFYTQYDVPLSEPMGPFPAHIRVNALDKTDWNELVYLPKRVVDRARSMEEYAIVLKTTFHGKAQSGATFTAQSSLLLLFPPAPFSKITPDNGAVDQSTHPVLNWRSSIGAIDYEYCFDTIDNNSCDTDWTGTYWLSTYDSKATLQNLPPGRTFYWQVRANNMAGTTYANKGHWWSFTTCSPTSITVTNTNDSGVGSLRQAITDICPGGTIDFHSSLSGQTITLSSTLLIDKDLTIDGSGLTAKITLSGDHQHRILQSFSPAQVNINHLGFSSAFATYGGAIHNTGNLTIKNSFFSDNAASNGAVIYNEGSLNLTNSILSKNSATYQGGGIFNFANLMITNSTFQQNSASDGGGIITILGSQTTITGSSFYNNTASSTGGAILIFPGTVSIANSTFFGNSSDQGGAISNQGGTLTVTNSSFSANIANEAGSIANAGILNYSNTILANSISLTDCGNYGSIGINTNNLVENNGKPPHGCGTPALASDPLLGSLADNGGSTLTMALLPGSPAINAGNDANCPSTDQRGVTRPQGSHCDIGAYETELDSIPPIVTSIIRASSNPTSAASVNFSVTFSEPVTGVSADDFTLHATGTVVDSTIQSVNGSDNLYTVTVNTGVGYGTLRLDVPVTATINDLSGNSLGSLPFMTGEMYALARNNGADTTGVFRPSNGLLYLKNSNTTGFADIAINYGIGGDYPVVGDWDGKGDATIGVYRGGKFYLRNSNTVGFADLVFAFGQIGDQPIAGDWDGDGIDTIGVYRPSTGQFLLRNSNSEGPAEMSFYLGNVGDVGIAGDWDGDGKDTTGVFRPINGIIFLKNTNETGFADVALNYGIPGDKPVTGDWDNDGIDTIGVYRNGQFLLRNSNTVGFADIVFGLGNPGDMPISGNWDGLP